MTSGDSTRRRIRGFPIPSGWFFSSTPLRTRVRGSSIPSATRTAVPGRTFVGRGGPADRLTRTELRHHAFVLVVQQVAVKQRHAANDRIGEVHDDVNRTADRDVDRVVCTKSTEPS